MGFYYRHGYYVPRNLRVATRWFRLAHSHGSNAAVGYLADEYLNSQSSQVVARGVALCEKEVRRGNVSAMAPYATFLVERDKKVWPRARRLLTKAAGAGIGLAALTLFRAYRRGRVTAKNLVKAREWLTCAARLDTPGAARMLAELLEFESSSFPEPTAAKRRLAFVWMSKAVEYDDHEARHALAWYFQCGYGTRKSVARAIKWYRSAARLGNQSSAFNLALEFYRRGERRKALRWFARAADLGHSRAARFLATGETKLISRYVPLPDRSDSP